MAAQQPAGPGADASREGPAPEETLLPAAGPVSGTRRASASSGARSSACPTKGLTPGLAWETQRIACPEGAARYWTDERYKTFYETSREERRSIKTSAAGAGLSSRGVEQMEAAWQRAGQGEPPRCPAVRGKLRVGEEPTEGRIARFEHAFASISGGKDTIRTADVRALLRTMQVPFDADRSQRLAEALEGAGQELPHDVALNLYRDLAPGPPGPREAKTMVELAIQEFLLDQECEDPKLTERVRPADGVWSRPVTPLTLAEHPSSKVVTGVIAGALQEFVMDEEETNPELAQRVRPAGGAWSPLPFAELAVAEPVAGQPLAAKLALPPALRRERAAVLASLAPKPPARDPLAPVPYSPRLGLPCPRAGVPSPLRQAGHYSVQSC